MTCTVAAALHADQDYNEIRPGCVVSVYYARAGEVRALRCYRCTRTLVRLEDGSEWLKSNGRRYGCSATENDRILDWE